MAIKDIASEIKVVPSIIAQTVTTGTPTGTGVDTLDYNSVVLEANVGTQAGTSNSIRWEDSDDNSTWARIPDADIDPDAYTTNKADLVVTVSNDINIYRWRYRGQKRYVRVNMFASSSGSLPLAMSVILGYPKHGPVAAWNA